MALLDHNALILGFRAVLLASVPTVASMSSAGKIITDNRGEYPNASKGALYLDEIWQPNTEQRVATGTNASIGRIEYGVLVPRSDGTEAASALAHEIAEAFEPGTSVPYGTGRYAHVDRAERFAGFALTQAWYRVPVSILWRAYSRSGN